MPIGLNSRMGMPGMMNRPMGGQGFMNNPMPKPGVMNKPMAAPKAPTNLGQPRANPTPKMQQPQQPTPAPGMEAWMQNRKAQLKGDGLNLLPPSVLQNRQPQNWDAHLRALIQSGRKELNDLQNQRTQQHLEAFGPAMIGGRGGANAPFQRGPAQAPGTDQEYQNWLEMRKGINGLFGRPPEVLPKGVPVPEKFQPFLGMSPSADAFYALSPSSPGLNQYGNALRGLYG